jgi:hypothetical protein
LGWRWTFARLIVSANDEAEWDTTIAFGWGVGDVGVE